MYQRALFIDQNNNTYWHTCINASYSIGRGGGGGIIDSHGSNWFILVGTGLHLPVTVLMKTSCSESPVALINTPW